MPRVLLNQRHWKGTVIHFYILSISNNTVCMTTYYIV